MTKKSKTITARAVAITSIAVFAVTAIFDHQSVISYFALALAIYLSLVTLYHEKHQELTWEIVAEYVLGGFILWFVASSLW